MTDNIWGGMNKPIWRNWTTDTIFDRKFSFYFEIVVPCKLKSVKPVQGLKPPGHLPPGKLPPRTIATRETANLGMSSLLLLPLQPFDLKQGSGV